MMLIPIPGRPRRDVQERNALRVKPGSTSGVYRLYLDGTSRIPDAGALLTMERPFAIILHALTLSILTLSASLASADALNLSGLRDVRLLDAGIFAVSGKPGYGRVETFEFLRRPDGGVTLLSATTLNDGSVRVQARYDYDAQWNSLQAVGQGIYENEPVRVRLEAEPASVSVSVRGEETRIDASVPCPAEGCFMDLAPSGSPMFVMTRRYDVVRGGEQTFRWAAQDLRRPFTSPDNQRATLRLRRELPVTRADGSRLVLRDYEMVERIPTPDGGVYVMEFDLWTDDENRPMGYRINTAGGKPSTSGVMAFRQGYEDLRAVVD
jgi:hypothetical protein